jgi:hypothetical protein
MALKKLHAIQYNQYPQQYHFKDIDMYLSMKYEKIQKKRTNLDKEIMDLK